MTRDRYMGMVSTHDRPLIAARLSEGPHPRVWLWPRPWSTAVRIALIAFAAVVGTRLQAATELAVVAITGGPGAPILVPINFSSSERIVALQFDVRFDGTRVESGEPAGGGALANHLVASTTPTNGVRSIVIYSLTNAQLTNGTLIQLPFTANSDFTNGTTSVSLANAMVVNNLGTSVVPVNLVSGALTLSSARPLAAARLGGLIRPRDGAVQFQLSGEIGGRYAIEISTNLTSWVRLSTNTATAAVITISDPGITNLRQRFYRAVTLP